jgi:hypothetical protein
MKEKLIIGLLWFFGLVFLIRGLTLFGESFMGAVFMTLSGVALLPIAHNKIRQLTNKDISLKWFLAGCVVLAICTGKALERSERKALENGTASPELIAQDKERKQYQENERLKQERIEAKKLADKEARERMASTKTPQSSNDESSRPMSFSDCKRIAASTRDALAETQYKTTVHIDNSSVYEIEICTNDGSVDVLCDGKKQEMTIFKMRKCGA